MAYNEKLADKVREALVAAGDIEEKKMFRGVTFMVKGKMCICVVENQLMCRIDPAVHEGCVEKNGCNTVVMKGRELKGYVLVGEEAMKTKKDFDHWIKLSLDFNEKAKASKKKHK